MVLRDTQLLHDLPFTALVHSTVSLLVMPDDLNQGV